MVCASAQTPALKVWPLKFESERPGPPKQEQSESELLRGGYIGDDIGDYCRSY